MYILGISCYYHDASAALLKDGVVVAAAQEERFTRKKHDASFPINAIHWCLQDQGIGIDEVAHIAFYEKPLLKFERLLSQHLAMFPRSYKVFLSSTPSWFFEKLRVVRTARRRLKYRGDVLFVEHHMAHAASGFLLGPFEEAAILTVDGVGEWSTTTWGVGRGTRIELRGEIRFPHSLGLLYSTITAYLGFSVNNSEYKVMGLAPYGRMDRKRNPYYAKLRKVIDIRDDGSFRLDMRYFAFHYKDRMPSRALCDLLGGPVREPESEVSARHKDIAAAVQLVYEEAIMKMLKHIRRETRLDEVIICGGCGLNSVCNGKILRGTGFKRVWIHPDAGDGGTSIGAAAYVYHSLLGHKRQGSFAHAYLGPRYADAEIRRMLDERGITYHRMTTQKRLVQTAARLIHEGQVVGWFSGRMEWGPRALGARSILSNPCDPRMQEILNVKVKHRERFRPFAPVVCADDAAMYFECDHPLPEPTDYMLMVYPIRPQWRNRLPAVTHVDGSGRLQTVRRHQNPDYYDLIKEFGKRSGVPVLINTSFNIRGEPIVCTPLDAYRCMMGTGIDCVFLGRYLVRRDENLRDAWDSERHAVD